jgi:hypothetical protein
LIVRQTTLSFSNHFMYIIIHTNLILCSGVQIIKNIKLDLYE